MRTWFVLPLLLLVVACDSSGVDASAGLEATLRVAGATYFTGEMPVPAEGPPVGEVNSNNNNVLPGQVGKRLTGRLGHGGDALALALDGDTGYWSLPAGLPDVLMPDQLTFDARLSFAKTLVPGEHTLTVRAVDAEGHFGPASTLVLTAAAAAPRTLDVKLTWDTESDVDLHLQLPGDPPIIVWSQNLNSYQTPPPPAQPDPTEVAAGGILDFDSNTQCVIDGRREENVFWTQAPPSGTYQARVDLFSLCGQAAAHWTMVVKLGDQELGKAEGTLGEDATKTAHDAAAGTLALTFTVP